MYSLSNYDRALKFISNNTMSDINVQDVADMTGVSRRLLDLCFAEWGNTNVWRWSPLVSLLPL